MLQDRVIEALRARGAAFAANLAELVTLRATLVDGVDLEPVMHSMIEIEDRIVETVCGNLTELERSRCAVVVEDAWKPYANKLWSRVQEQNFRTARMQAEALLMMGIPRLGTLYA